MDFDHLIQEVEEQREKGIKKIERNKDIKRCVAKVVLGTIIVIGAVAAIAGFVALAVATGVAPAVLVAAAAGIGVTATTTVTVGSVTVGLAGAAGAVAGAGVMLDVISGGALSYTLGKIEKSAANDVVKLDEKLAGELTEKIHDKVRGCRMVELGVKEFVKELSVHQGRT